MRHGDARRCTAMRGGARLGRAGRGVALQGYGAGNRPFLLRSASNGYRCDFLPPARRALHVGACSALAVPQRPAADVQLLGDGQEAMMSYIVMQSDVVQKAARNCLASIYRKRKKILRERAIKQLTWPFGLRKQPSEEKIRNRMRYLWLNTIFAPWRYSYGKQEDCCLALIRASKLSDTINISVIDADWLSGFMEK